MVLSIPLALAGAGGQRGLHARPLLQRRGRPQQVEQGPPEPGAAQGGAAGGGGRRCRRGPGGPSAEIGYGARRAADSSRSPSPLPLSARANSAVDMRQLTSALLDAREGTGEVRAVLLRAAFKPRLPGGVGRGARAGRGCLQARAGRGWGEARACIDRSSRRCARVRRWYGRCMACPPYPPSPIAPRPHQDGLPAQQGGGVAQGAGGVRGGGGDGVSGGRLGGRARVCRGPCCPGEGGQAPSGLWRELPPARWCYLSAAAEPAPCVQPPAAGWFPTPR